MALRSISGDITRTKPARRPPTPIRRHVPMDDIVPRKHVVPPGSIPFARRAKPMAAPAVAQGNTSDSVDAVHARAFTQQTPHVQPRKEVLDAAKTATPKAKTRRWLELIQYPLIAAVALAAAYSATAGQVLIILFAMLAIVRRLSSRWSFGVALFILVTIPLFEAIGQSGIAQNAAIYVYELLVVGTVTAIIELRKTAKTPN